MANTSHSGSKPPELKRLKGAATTYGTEYEFCLAGLLALRLRRKGLAFQLFTNVAAARPLDDLVLRILGPKPLIIFIQLKHANTNEAATPVTTQAFTPPSGDFSIRKYFEFYETFERAHTTPGISKTEDEQLLHDCCLEDVRVVIYTNRPVCRRQGATDGPHLHFDHEDLLRTDDGTNSKAVFSFGCKDEKVWKLYDNNPRKDDYQQEFLPRLRVFSEQAHVNDVKELIRSELDAVFGAPLPRSENLLLSYIESLKAWAQDPSRGTPLTNSSGELELLLAEELAKQGRAAAGGGALLFDQERCAELKRTLEDGEDAVEVRVRGVKAGHRAAKVVQVLDEHFAGRWVYVGDQQLREFPLGALEAACGAAHVQFLLLDVEREKEVQSLVSKCSGRVVAVSSAQGAGPLRSVLPRWVTLEEDWRLNHLTPKAQESLMDASINFQGSEMPLQALAPSWPSVREDADGALLSALLREGAAMGVAPPAPDDNTRTYVPRTLEHPSTLDPDVVGKLDPGADHLVLSGFPLSFLRNLNSKLVSEDGASGRRNIEENHVENAHHSDGNGRVAIKENEW